MLQLSAFGPPRCIDDLLAHDRIAIFGASAGAAEVEALLQDHGKSVECYFDNNTARQGTPFRNRTICAPSEAREFAHAGGAIIIAAAYQVEIATQLVGELGISRTQVFPFVSRMFAHHFGQAAIEPHLSEIEALLPRLADEASRRYVSGLVRFRWTMDPLDLRRNPYVTGFYQYNRTDVGPKPGDHIVDCGAFTGDSAQVFLDRLGGLATITAIEPLARNYAVLKRWVADANLHERVALVRAAIGAAPGEASIAAGEDPADPRAHLGDSTGEAVPIDTLDRLFAGRYRTVGFIKIDIEGFELDALQGASALIGETTPGLAVAGYHKPAHLWEVPALIDRLTPAYSIYVGHHPSAPYECEFYCAAKRHDAVAA